jgi:membrane-bound lytic murein transglycosylase B
MNRQQAHSQWTSLRRMTVANGCTPDEAATAKGFADRLEAKYVFSMWTAYRSTREPDERTKRWAEYVRRYKEAKPERAQAKQREYEREYQEAVKKFAWEGRQCGKAACWCMRTGGYHGPYKYRKERYGFKNRRVHSIYLGKHNRSEPSNKRGY